MPRYKKYKGESPLAAKKRIGRSRRGSAFNKGLVAGRGRNESGGIPYNPFKPIKSDPLKLIKNDSPGQDDQDIEAVWDSPGWDGREPEWDWGTLSGDDQENEGPSDFGSPEEPGTPGPGTDYGQTLSRGRPRRNSVGRKKLPKTYKLKPFKKRRP